MSWRWVGIEDDRRNRAAIESNALKIYGDVGVPEPVGTYTVPQPNLVDGFVFTIHDIAGTVSAKNFISLFNPVNSERYAQIRSLTVSSYTVGASDSPNSMVSYRTSAASGGTLVSSANIPHQYISQESSAMEVRHNNPAATISSSAIQAFPPPLGESIPGSGRSMFSVAFVTGLGPVVPPGSGYLMRTAAGDTDARMGAWCAMT